MVRTFSSEYNPPKPVRNFEINTLVDQYTALRYGQAVRPERVSLLLSEVAGEVTVKVVKKIKYKVDGFSFLLKKADVIQLITFLKNSVKEYKDS